MDLGLIGKSFTHWREKKRWVITLGTLGISAYGAYRVYTLPCVAEKRKRLLKLISTIVLMAQVASDSADVMRILSRDLDQFIQSDSDKISRSFRQLSKVAASDEISKSMMKIFWALALGVLLAYRQDIKKNDTVSMSEKSAFSCMLMDKLLTDAGSGFASVVVGSFARKLIMTFYSSGVDHLDMQTGRTLQRVDILHEDKCQEFLVYSIQRFVSTAVTVFLDKNKHLNTHQELSSGLTNHKHETQVENILLPHCNGELETLVETSVFTSKDTKTTIDSIHSGMHTTLGSFHLNTTFGQNYQKDNRELMVQRSISDKSEARKLYRDSCENGWLRNMSSNMEVPSNNRWNYLKRNIDLVQEEVVNMGSEVAERVRKKSPTIVIACLSFCLDVVNSPWSFVPN